MRANQSTFIQADSILLRRADRINAGYLAAFSREPASEELDLAAEHVLRPREDAQGNPLDPQRARRQGYEDLLWAIMNTKEFLFNH